MNGNINRHLFCFRRFTKGCFKEDQSKAIAEIVSPEAKALESIPKIAQNTRRCIIYRPAKTAMQSGTNETNRIRLEFDKTTTKWESRVLGWTSSADSLQGLIMHFADYETAESYCKAHGLQYTVRDDTDKEYVIKPKMYADNFRYSPDKLKLIRTK